MEPSAHIPEEVKKVRAVPHIEGNFASYVFVACVSATEDLAEEVKRLLSGKTGVPSIPPTEWHVSLSRPLYLKHFQLAPFLARLTEKLRSYRKFAYSITTANPVSFPSEGSQVFYHSFLVNVGRDKVCAYAHYHQK